MSDKQDRDVERAYSTSEFVSKLRRLADALETGKRFEDPGEPCSHRHRQPPRDLATGALWRSWMVRFTKAAGPGQRICPAAFSMPFWCEKPTRFGSLGLGLPGAEDGDGASPSASAPASVPGSFGAPAPFVRPEDRAFGRARCCCRTVTLSLSVRYPAWLFSGYARPAPNYPPPFPRPGPHPPS
jgi:hypothetical protein